MKSEISKLNEALKNVSDILIVPHTSADGDAIGSSVALKSMLEYMGKVPKLYIDTPLSNKFEDFKDCFIVKKETDHVFEMVIYVDCGEKARAAVTFPEPKISACIDHHVSNNHYGDINIIDVNSPATGEIIFGIYEELNIPISDFAAMAMYMAIVCDTGCFVFDNTRENTHIIASKLHKYNFPRYELIRKCYLQKSIKYTKLEAKMFENLYINNDFIMGYIDNKSFSEVEASNDDTDGLANVLRNIEGMDLAVFLCEKEKGTIKGSIRTSKKYDANALASQFSGGGHIRAAGFKTTLKFDEIKDKINEWLSTCK